MNWRVGFSNNALKFLDRNNLDEDFAVEKVKLAVRRFKGEHINLDIKKLGGEWRGFYRIRSGKIRIIAEFDFEQRRAYGVY